ncbi:hypothetical protein Patl1_15642 [Pistacia atlantica]|uniref:Uncharacterized protein n=1 Tax=Pistacia atlantica TaxID=434234 RepID=A0ACC1B5X9_9ROSI|nr:hypothetical protein Patl1_15642 [Pistacia atlantica]
MAPRSRSYQISATPVTIFAHLLVIAVATLVLVWLLHNQEGFAFKSDNKLKIFNFSSFTMNQELRICILYILGWAWAPSASMVYSAETGLVQKFLILGLFRGQEALIVNFIGILLILFAISVGLGVVLPRVY